MTKPQSRILTRCKNTMMPSPQGQRPTKSMLLYLGRAEESAIELAISLWEKAHPEDKAVGNRAGRTLAGIAAEWMKGRAK